MDRLISWAFEKRIDMVWAICSSPKLIGIFEKKLPFKIPIPFAYHCDHPSTTSLFQGHVVPIQAIDSDFDLIYH